MAKTKIIKLENDWKDVKNVSRTTVNKKHSEIEATTKFKRAMLISEHSPIRLIKVRWLWEGIESFVATHFSRSRWECFISTQRSDRLGVDTSSNSRDTPVNFEGEANAQHLIDTARKRLCYCSAPETVRDMTNLKIVLMESEASELGECLVPNCIYRFSCPEFEVCGHFQVFLDHNQTASEMTIQERYDAYNSTFYSNHMKEIK